MNNTLSFKLPQTGKLLLDEAPLVVLPSLARAIGLEGAVILQQLHFLIRIKLERHREHPKESERDIHDGRVWVWNSYQKWQENYFSFLSVRSLQRIFLDLEKKKLIFAANYNKYNLNKTKWYSINYDHQLIKGITTTGIAGSNKTIENNNSLVVNSDQRETVVDGAKLAHSTCQIGTIDSANLALSYTNNTTKTSTKTTTTTKDELLLTKFYKKENHEQNRRKQRSIKSESSSDIRGKPRGIETAEIKVKPSDAFPVPTTAEEAENIIQEVLRIVYPNNEGIKNKNTLIHVMKKKLKEDQLEIPKGWYDLQKNKKETADQESQNIADEFRFQKAKEEFARSTEYEQNKYLDAARRTARGITLQEATARCVAIQLRSRTANLPYWESRPP